MQKVIQKMHFAKLVKMIINQTKFEIVTSMIIGVKCLTAWAMQAICLANYDSMLWKWKKPKPLFSLITGQF